MILRTERHHYRLGLRNAKVNDTILKGNNIKVRNQQIVLLDGLHENILLETGAVHHSRYLQVLHQQLITHLDNILTDTLVYLAVEHIVMTHVPLHRTILGQLAKTATELGIQNTILTAAVTTPVNTETVKTILGLSTQCQKTQMQIVYQ